MYCLNTKNLVFGRSFSFQSDGTPASGITPSKPLYYAVRKLYVPYTCERILSTHHVYVQRRHRAQIEHGTRKSWSNIRVTVYCSQQRKIWFTYTFWALQCILFLSMFSIIHIYIMAENTRSWRSHTAPQNYHSMFIGLDARQYASTRIAYASNIPLVTSIYPPPTIIIFQDLPNILPSIKNSPIWRDIQEIVSQESRATPVALLPVEFHNLHISTHCLPMLLTTNIIGFAQIGFY